MGFTAAEGFVDLTVGNVAGFGRDMAAAQRRLDKLGRGLGAATRTARNFLIGLGAGVGLAAAAAGREEQSFARLKAVVTATGAAAGFSAEQLRDQANALQEVTTFGNESIMGVQALVATFKGIKGDEFQRVTEIALDLAQVLQTDAKTGALQLGKALEDPLRGVTALRRAGISFNAVEMEQIRLMQESGQLMEAQRLVLRALEGQVGGTARAMGETATGQLVQFKNAIADALEVVGELFLPELAKLATMIKDMLPAIERFVRAHGPLIVTLTTAAAALAAVVFVGGKLGLTVVSLISVVNKLGGVAGVLKGLGGAFVNFASVASVALVGVAAFILGKSIGEALDEKWDISGWVATQRPWFDAYVELWAKTWQHIGSLAVRAGKASIGQVRGLFDLLSAIRSASRRRKQQEEQGVDPEKAEQMYHAQVVTAWARFAEQSMGRAEAVLAPVAAFQADVAETLQRAGEQEAFARKLLGEGGPDKPVIDLFLAKLGKNAEALKTAYERFRAWLTGQVELAEEATFVPETTVGGGGGGGGGGGDKDRTGGVGFVGLQEMSKKLSMLGVGKQDVAKQQLEEQRRGTVLLHAAVEELRLQRTGEPPPITH